MTGMRRTAGRRRSLAAGVALVMVVGWDAAGSAQTLTPPSISISPPSPVCSMSNDSTQACITLPPLSILPNVDVFLLFDDTGSLEPFVPTVNAIFTDLVTDLETALPGVTFGFGVGRFEDYGGPGNGFSPGGFQSQRPFILNQPIVTAADAGGAAARDALIATALGNTAPGDGGDNPESDMEALFQTATGLGFDGNGDASTTGLGGTQVAGNIDTQTNPDNSGDVPAFSTLEGGVISSGNVGGAGFRSDALKLVVMITDICSVSPFDAGMSIPASIIGTGSTEPSSDFACVSTTPGTERFGFVSDSKTLGGNSVLGAVAPEGSSTVPAAVAALNAGGIQVIGVGPGAGPVPSGSGPGVDESIFLSAIARMTGAVDSMGNPLVFDLAGGGTPLEMGLVNAIIAASTVPVDVKMTTSGVIPGGLSVGITPPLVPDVGPSEQACFNVSFTGSGNPIGFFGLQFRNNASNGVLGTVPVSVNCPPGLGLTLVLSRTLLKYDNSPTFDLGKAIIRALLNDQDTAGGFAAAALANMASVRIRDSGVFDHTFPLTGCVVKSSGLIKCRSADHKIKAIFDPTRQGPFVYNMRFKASKLSDAETGASQPVGPVLVTVNQGMVARSDTISACHQRGHITLSCVEP